MSNRSDCSDTTVAFTRQAALAMGVPGVICLALSIVGLIAELVFVCKKKNNFLLRLYIYLSVTVLTVHFANTLYLIISVYPQKGLLCEIIETVEYYQSTVELFFIISINCVLLYKVYTSVRRSCYHCHGSKTIEVIFVVAHFIIPLFTVGVPDLIKGFTNSGKCHINCIGKSDFDLLKITTEYIPVGIEILLSILCTSTLSVWLCWLLRKHFLRARMKTILKEIGLLLGFLSSYCIIRIVIEILNIFWKKNSVTIIISYALYPINRATIPLSFIIYVCFVYLCPPRSDNDTNPPTDQHTYPPSTRVSLPSNTADQALNFLSKSELISSSHKNSKRGTTETTALLLN